MDIKNSISINSNPVFSTLNSIENISSLNTTFESIYNNAYLDTASGPTIEITLGSLDDGLRIESISTTYSFAPGVSCDSVMSKLQSSLNINNSYGESASGITSNSNAQVDYMENESEIVNKPSDTQSVINNSKIDLSPSKVSFKNSNGDVFDSSKPKPSKDQIYEWIDKYSTKYGIDSSLIKAIIEAESNFNHQVISRSGAVGLIQLMPVTAREMGLTVNDAVDERWDPEKNIEAGIAYISKYHKIISNHFGYEDWNLTMAAYNAGPNRVMRDGGIPNIQETKNYVKKVNQYWAKYK